MGEGFAEFDTPLVEGVDIPDYALGEDAHFVERDEAAEGGGGEFFGHEDIRGAVSFEDAVGCERGGGAFGFDLGEGFSSLRLWSELRPDFVKIDMHFVQGVSGDRVKYQFLQSLQQIARGCGSALVAEGVETEADFCVLRDLGIDNAQGFLIGRAVQKPRLFPAGQVQRLLNSSAPLFSAELRPARA